MLDLTPTPDSSGEEDVQAAAMSTLVKQLEDLLAQMELRPAMEKLRAIFNLVDSLYHEEVIGGLGRLSYLEKQIRGETILPVEANVARNRLGSSLYFWVNEVKLNPAAYQSYLESEAALSASVLARSRSELPFHIKDVLFQRMAAVKEKNLTLPILWIDDQPLNNEFEQQALHIIGGNITQALTSSEASDLLDTSSFTLVISDISREGKATEGLTFLKDLMQQGKEVPPFIFYTGQVRRDLGVPPYAFGIADMPNELIHLVLDVIMRTH